MTVNPLYGNKKTDEWYTNPETAQKCLDLLEATPGSTVCCPFDTEASSFVKLLKNQGFNVIYNITDWLEVDYEYDYAVTNPPFSIKDKVIERALQTGKPTVLTLPIDSLAGVKRHDLFKQYGYPVIYIPTRRINYMDGTGKKRNSSYFPSIFMKLNAGDSNLIWE